MSTQIKQQQSYTSRIAREHSLVTDFLIENHDLLESLSYEAMSDKLGTDYASTPRISFYAYGDAVSMTVHGPNQRETMRVLRKAIGGKWDKGGYGTTFKLSRVLTFGDVSICLDIKGDRENVCQKVVTGIKEVHHSAVIAQAERTEYVDEVEWVCGNLLDD